MSEKISQAFVISPTTIEDTIKKLLSGEKDLFESKPWETHRNNLRSMGYSIQESNTFHSIFPERVIVTARTIEQMTNLKDKFYTGLADLGMSGAYQSGECYFVFE